MTALHSLLRVLRSSCEHGVGHPARCATLPNSPLSGTFAQAWCCARDVGCGIETVAAAAVDACESSAGCAMPCAEPPFAEAGNPSDEAPCVPTPERCPLLVSAPAEPVRSRPADLTPDDIVVPLPHPTVASIDFTDTAPSAFVLHARAPDLPVYLRLRHLLI